MMRAILCVATLVLAGCMAAAPEPEDTPVETDLSPWYDCPIRHDRQIPCTEEHRPGMPLGIQEGPHPSWHCMVAMDQQNFGQDHPYPDWYVYFGRKVPVEGEPVTVESRMGILYDAHDDASRIMGAVQLQLEGDPTIFTWEGPPRGFVEIPVPIRQDRLKFYGVLLPLEPTNGTYEDERHAPPGFHVEAEGMDVRQALPFWSVGPFLASDGTNRGEEDARTWDLVLNLHTGPWPLRMDMAEENDVGMPGPADPQSPGLGWAGVQRGAPYEGRIETGNVSIEASVQPYMAFHGEFRNVHDPVWKVTFDWFCRCAEEPLTTPEGILCALGRGPPVRTGEGNAGRITITEGFPAPATPM